ncbi:substrate-binding domain-containing protein [Candidatus Merdisoma sp. HCP28S3_D10]|uniref:substrate-binding domain-containing protein n=1 Tax=unclassified Candidatus Merdisoma TaxID=3099611 RepID=UPI003F8BAF7B
MKKKTVSLLMTMALTAAMLAGCGSSETADTTAAADTTAEAEDTAAAADTATADFDTEEDISVYSREDGSGTRGAFIELFGVEEKDANGEKIDNTTEDATITNNTSVMMTGVAGDDYAIGYVSLGSLNDTVKALKIDGVEPTVENIKSDSYKVYRPFNIATKGEVSEAAQDFIDYILSAEGQQIVSDEGYITIDDAAPAFAGGQASGSVTVAGSSSVSPVMEKLAEAYMKLNGNVKIEIQTSDSTTGMTSAIDGVCDIGMASRELKDTEAEKLTATVIAQDGIAVVVNNNNPIDNLTKDQVKSIYVGETTSWSEVE